MSSQGEHLLTLGEADDRAAAERVREGGRRRKRRRRGRGGDRAGRWRRGEGGGGKGEGERLGGGWERRERRERFAGGGGGGGAGGVDSHRQGAYGGGGTDEGGDLADQAPNILLVSASIRISDSRSEGGAKRLPTKRCRHGRLFLRKGFVVLNSAIASILCPSLADWRSLMRPPLSNTGRDQEKSSCRIVPVKKGGGLCWSMQERATSPLIQ